MKIKFILFLLLHTCLVGSAMAAQWITTDSIKIIPEYLVRDDTPHVLVYIRTAGTGINVFLEHNIQDSIISIKGCYTISGVTTHTKHHHDISLGELKEGTYTVIFTAYLSFEDTICTYHDSTKDTLKFVVESPVSIPTLNPASFTIYPSPANNALHINIPQGATIQKTVIYDVRGALLSQYTDSKKPLDISGIPAGMYFLYIDTDKGRVVKKFMIE